MTTAVAVERAKQLFRFLKAFAEKSVPPRSRYSDHHWWQWLVELPSHPSIVIGEVQLATASDSGASVNPTDSALITIKRPKLTQCPEPPDAILDFLRAGWRDPEKSVDMLESRNVVRKGETITEQFGDDPARVAAFDKWRAARAAWAAAERPARQAMKVFERFYELKGRIDRESERVELILGDGRLRWNNAKGIVDHPALLQRVELIFDPDVPEFRVVDSDREPELYGSVLLGDDAVVPQQINVLRTEVERVGYHPLAEDGTSGFLRRVVQTIAAKGVFEDARSTRAIGEHPVISRDAVLFLRDRASGFSAAFDRVLADLEQRAEVPTALSRLVGVEAPLPPQAELGEWSPWGEPPDILLSKPANEEQIHIARALDRHKAVLVQGPPGTGKSHTIANLVGHLVAHGKRVLITSHTTKALRVLRGQIVDTLKPLCVALLDNDLEGRAQMEEAVKGILTRLTRSTEQGLERELTSLAEQRSTLNRDISAITGDLRLARENEYQPILIGGESIPPSDAARWVKENRGGNDWIPGPVEASAPLPLSLDEVHELYRTNGLVSLEEQVEISAGLPQIDSVPTVEEFRSLVGALGASEPPHLAAFWAREPAESALPVLKRLSDLAGAASQQLAGVEPWQRSLIAIGHQGGADAELWNQLEALIEKAHDRLQEAKGELLQHDPKLPPAMSPDEALRISREIEEHLRGGGSLGTISLMFHSEWKAFIRAATCDGHSLSSPADARAICICAELQASRARLASRWARQAVPIGLPAFESFGSDPEPKIREYSKQFARLIAWWAATWPQIEAAMAEAGFRWDSFRDREVARSGPLAPFERDVAILSGALLEAISYRVAVCNRLTAIRRLNWLESLMADYSGSRCAAVCRALRNRDVTRYDAARDALVELMKKGPVASRRTTLLEKLKPAAPHWARAIENRAPGHDAQLPSENVVIAWRWRQINQEVERRAALDEVKLTERLHQLRGDLRETTAKVIDRRAWLGQIRRVDLNARQALQGWADIQRRIGKGTGKRVPVLQAEARKLLAQARDAVPVWIMPLSRVAESFDAARGKFDVVIIDEASQSDVTGLLAWYLGERVAVVGDHQQVSPSAVGEKIENTAQLIAEHLVDVPNATLFDGKLSVYDLARQSFGGTIALREHFRCVPDIIDFSNYLSYNGDIRPLRDPTRVARPHVIEHVVAGTRSPDGKKNLVEARTIVALVKALSERPEYGSATMGAISLLGDEQAGLLQDLALQLIGAVEMDRRRFAAGNAAQFQGDERDIMFLSMVDSPQDRVLSLRQDDALKQRYNVAASRAKDQMWLVHSLDPSRDLNVADLRWRLIEHVRNPGSRRAAIQVAQSRAESPFESRMLQLLMSAGFRVEPQVWVGQYRIDMVVSDDAGQVAIECDGDRFHGVDQIPADMARQAVLERAGWRFIRVRGTRFYRNEDETMKWVFGELERLGIKSTAGGESSATPIAGATEFRDCVVRRAWEIMREQGWVEPIPSTQLEMVQ